MSTVSAIAAAFVAAISIREASGSISFLKYGDQFKKVANRCCDFAGESQRTLFGRRETYEECAKSCQDMNDCVGFEQLVAGYPAALQENQDISRRECWLLKAQGNDPITPEWKGKWCSAGATCHKKKRFEDSIFKEVHQQCCQYEGLGEVHKHAEGHQTFADCRFKCEDEPTCVAFDRRHDDGFCTLYYPIDSENIRATLKWESGADGCVCVQKRKYWISKGTEVERTETEHCRRMGYEKVLETGRRLF